MAVTAEPAEPSYFVCQVGGPGAESWRRRTRSRPICKTMSCNALPSKLLAVDVVARGVQCL